MNERKLKIISTIGYFSFILLIVYAVGLNLFGFLIAVLGVVFFIVAPKDSEFNRLKVTETGVFVSEWKKELSYLEIKAVGLNLIHEGKHRSFELVIHTTNDYTVKFADGGVTFYWDLIKKATAANGSIVLINIPESEKKMLILLDGWVEYGKNISA